MKNTIAILFSLFLLPLLASCQEKKVHIVYFGEHKGDKSLNEIQETHISHLSSVKESKEEAIATLLYSYMHSINGYAALLTPDEASKLSEMEEVVSVIPTNPGKYSLQTTRSWEFSGLQEESNLNHLNSHFEMGEELLLKARYGKNVIVGLLDNVTTDSLRTKLLLSKLLVGCFYIIYGVWPESKSFRDEGMGRIPKSWKGTCVTGTSFNSSHCNKKIIGARYYLKGFESFYGKLNETEDYKSPRDADGHGTHTASTAVGNRVPNAAAYGGFAIGTASGGAPLAHLAIYKACWAIPNQDKALGNTCFEEDMLAAIDDAIGDGVHVLSISIGTQTPITYENDGIAIGSFHAVKNNIVVVCAAGNAGPAPSTLSNPAPWILTVGASTVDRAFVGPVLLGNGKEIKGETVTPDQLKEMHPLVLAQDVVAPGVPANETSQCLPNSLSPEKVKGKIVFCMRGLGMRVLKGMEVKRAGGAGFILGNTHEMGNQLSADAHVLPATGVGATAAKEIIDYIKSTKNPMAAIGKARTVLGFRPAPTMAAFSSRGPNLIDPNILKPDITAPGVNILAAWSGASSPTKVSGDNRSVKYNIDSGTSMACPHVAAAAALLKALHPKWSSAAIRSALMTSAWMKNNLGLPITDSTGNVSNPFQFGSGHFRPARAADPGLVYDATYQDYVHYLCNYGYSQSDPDVKCPKETSPTYNLNYPSVAIPQLNGTVTIKRTVTNVGPKKSTYFFSAKPPLGFSVEASPSILFFNKVGKKSSFTITVKATDGETAKLYQKGEYAFGWFTWTDSYHYVRSPLAVSLA